MKLLDLEQSPPHLGPQLRLGHVLQHELGLQRAAELPVGGVEAVRGLEAVEPLQRGGRRGVPGGERRVELADAVPLLGDETEVHRPTAALEDRLEGLPAFRFMPSMPQGAPVEATGAAVAKLEAGAARLRRQLVEETGRDYFRHVLAAVGDTPLQARGGGPTGPAVGSFAASNVGEVAIELIPSEHRVYGSEALGLLWRDATEPIAEAIEVDFALSTMSADSDVDVQLADPDLDVLRAAAEEVKQRLRGYACGATSPWQKSRIRPGPGAAEPRRLHGMAMGKRPVARQASPLWVETADLPTSDGHPFFARLNRVLEDCGFDAFVEGLCSAFYAARLGRPSLRPGRYFRMLLIGYFEGLSSERGIAWRVADSLSLRSFVDLELSESAPDHSTLSRTRRLIDVETHEAVFTWVLERLSEAGLVVGKTVGIDATTLEANAAMRSIERRDTGESYEAFIRRLAEASGVETPTRADLARFDRSRKDKKTSNKEWQSPQDPDAKIAKMKDGRTHLAHKAEHGVDMDTGAIVSVSVQAASEGDTATLPETLIMAAEQVEAVQPDGPGVEEMVADKGYHSDETLVGLKEVGVRSHVSEPERGRRCWQDKKTGETPPEKRAAQKALYANRRRVRGRRGRRLQRLRGELVERTFAHMYETGGMRRVWVRGHENVRKRVLIQAAACNIGLLLRRQTGVGTPRSLQGRALSAIYGLIGLWRGCWERLRRVWGLKRSMLHLEAA